MKSGENGLIGPGNNNYGEKDGEEKPDIDEAKVIQLADKIYKSVCKANYDNQVSKEKVLHHLKQLKAQMGKERFNDDPDEDTYGFGVQKCMEMIDKKIEKVNKL